MLQWRTMIFLKLKSKKKNQQRKSKRLPQHLNGSPSSSSFLVSLTTRQKSSSWNSLPARKKASPMLRCRRFRILDAVLATLMWCSKARMLTKQLYRNLVRGSVVDILTLKKLRAARSQNHRKAKKWPSWCLQIVRHSLSKDYHMTLKRMISVIGSGASERLKVSELQRIGRPKNQKVLHTSSLRLTKVQRMLSSRWMAKRYRVDISK